MSYRKILSIVNEHSASTVIARYAIALAEACQAELVLYTAHAEGTDEKILLHSERHLDHLFKTAFERGIATTCFSETGKLGALLPKRARAEDVDLVFYPLTPDEHYEAHLQQHTVHTLLRTVTSDLAVMRVVHMGKLHPHRILTPLGGVVRDGQQRVRFIAALAACFHSRVTLFHLTTGKDIHKIPEDIISFRNELRQHHIAVEERIARGHISKSITVEAITRHNDLIVLGASERTTLRRLLFGNPVGDVMHRPPCNVLLFRAVSDQP